MTSKQVFSHCVGCGLPAKVLTNDEGTSHYEPIYNNFYRDSDCSVCGRTERP